MLNYQDIFGHFNEKRMHQHSDTNKQLCSFGTSLLNHCANRQESEVYGDIAELVGREMQISTNKISPLVLKDVISLP